MKISTIVPGLFFIPVLLSGCTLMKPAHGIDYDRDYIYTVRAPSSPPNWNNTTYPGYNWGNYPWYGSNWGL